MKVLFTIFLLGILFSAPLYADQNSDKLDSLFEILQRADTTPRQASVATSEIWQQWLSTDNARAQVLMVRGIRQMNAFELDSAVETFTTLIKLAPDFAEAWNKRATAYYMMGRFDDSSADVEQTLRLEPRHFGALSGQGTIHFRNGRKGSALIWYRRALDVNPFMDSVRETVEILEEELQGTII